MRPEYQITPYVFIRLEGMLKSSVKSRIQQVVFQYFSSLLQPTFVSHSVLDSFDTIHSQFSLLGAIYHFKTLPKMNLILSLL